MKQIVERPVEAEISTDNNGLFNIDNETSGSSIVFDVKTPNGNSYIDLTLSDAERILEALTDAVAYARENQSKTFVMKRLDNRMYFFEEEPSPGDNWYYKSVLTIENKTVVKNRFGAL